MKNKIDIIYIAGYVRSGSTIFDIILGNIPFHFSTGELLFFTTNGLRDNELCSCTSRVSDCVFWSAVAVEWASYRELSLEEYNNVLHNHFRNKKSFSLFGKLLFPDKAFRKFLKDTRCLYEIIIKQSGGKTIIESSKSPYRILLLKKIGMKVTVVHLVRNLKDVLIATQKTLLANPELGIEKNIFPRNKWKVIVTWLLSNFYTKIFTIGMHKVKVRYEELISDPIHEVSRITSFPLTFKEKLTNRGPFLPGHVVAGNRLRMQPSFFISKPPTIQENKTESIFIRYLTKMANWIFW